jgi:hypothetical protein
MLTASNCVNSRSASLMLAQGSVSRSRYTLYAKRFNDGAEEPASSSAADSSGAAVAARQK